MTDIQASQVAGQHAQIGVLTQSEGQEGHTQHPDAQWFGAAGLGVFFHWGISSVYGDGDLSWSMIHVPPGQRKMNSEHYGLWAVQRTLPPAEYWKQAEHFQPDRYDPQKWMAALRDAGVKYAVLTTKHHDGFALWPSDHGDFNTKNYLGGRDLVGEYVEACRAFGIKVGFYYSPPDWWFDRHVMSFNSGSAEPALDIYHQPVDLPQRTKAQISEHKQAHRRLVAGQTEELLSRYGKIDILWFDGDADAAISLERIRALQPGIIVNRRGLGAGDFETPECSYPKARIPGWWEYCHIWNDGAWGYLKHETYKPLGWMTGEMAKARAWGGSFLINMGPDAHGQLPETAYRRLNELSDWLSIHSEAIFDTEPGLWPERCNVPVTVKSDTWYLHVHQLVDYPIVVSGTPLPAEARWLRTNHPVSFRREGDTVVFDLPPGMPSLDGDVLAVRWS